MSSTKRYETDEVARDRLAEALKELPENWVMCRDMRHAWTVDEDFHVSLHQGSKIQQIKRVLVCMRCATRRVEFYVPSRYYGLEKIHSNYEYPANYQIHGVPRGMKPQWLVQQEQYRRAMVKAAALQQSIS